MSNNKIKKLLSPAEEILLANQLNDVNITLESIEAVINTGQETLKNHPDTITTDMIINYHKHSKYLLGKLSEEVSLLGIDDTIIKEGSVTLEAIDDLYTDPKVALEGIMDSIKKGIKTIIGFIVAIINTILASIFLVGGLIVLVIWGVYKKIIDIVSTATHWVVGSKVKGNYYFKSFDDFKTALDEASDINTAIYSSIVKVNAVIVDGLYPMVRTDKDWNTIDTFYLPKMNTYISELYKAILVEGKSNKFIRITPGAVEGQVKFEFKNKKPVYKKMKVPTKKVLKGSLSTITSKNHKKRFVINTEQVEILKKTLEGIAKVYDKQPDGEQKTKLNKLLMEIRTYVMLVVGGISMVSSVYKTQARDVFTIVSNIPELELPNEWKDDITHVFTKANS